MGDLYDFYLKAGGTAPKLKIALENENNSAVDITGAKGAKFSLRLASNNSTMLVTNATATITDSVNGYVQYTWKVGNTSAYDNAEAQGEFRITLSDNTILIVPDNGYISVKIGDALI